MDIKDIRKSEHQEFVTPQTVEGEVAVEQQENTVTTEGADLQTARGALAEQKNPEVAMLTASARPTEAMTAKELTDLGLDPSLATGQSEGREKVLLGALLNTEIKVDGNNAGTPASELQDLAFGLKETK